MGKDSGGGGTGSSGGHGGGKDGSGGQSGAGRAVQLAAALGREGSSQPSAIRWWSRSLDHHLLQLCSNLTGGIPHIL